MMQSTTRQLQSDMARDPLIKGYVVDNNDPEKRQRVRVVIPGTLEAQSVEDLPWLAPINHVPGGCGDNYGSVSVPRLGSRVRVIVQDEDYANAVYDGDFASANFIMPGELAENYPNRLGWITPFNDLIYLDVVSGEFLVRRASGSGFVMDKDGNVSVIATGNWTQVVKGDYTLQVDGKNTLIVKGDSATQVGGTDTLQVSGDHRETIGGSFSHSSTSRSINGPESASGPVNVQNDLTASGISVSKHHTSGVKGGSDVSGLPIP